MLLVEAGPAVPTPAVTTVDALAALDEPGWLWAGVTAEVVTSSGVDPGRLEAVDRQAVPYRQGRGLGGGTAVNSLVLGVGDRADYDRWASEADCPGWDWAAMEPWFARALRALRPTTVPFGPLAAALGAVAADRGHPTGGRSAEIDAVGYLAADLAVEPASAVDRVGRRRSAVDTHLRMGPGGATPPTLTVRADSAVSRVMIDGGMAGGVVLDDGSPVRSGTVVLAAGALASPGLLWRSGIRHPSLGRTVSDHPSFVFTVALRPHGRRDPGRPAPPISALLRWSSSRHPGDRSAGPQSPVNDLAAQVLDHVGAGTKGRRYGAVIVMLADVESTGRASFDPGTISGGTDTVGPGPRFAPGWLVEAGDRDRLVAGVRHVASLLADPALAAGDGVVEQVLIDDRGTPLDVLDEMTDSEVAQWLVDHPGPVSHAAATLPLDLRERPGPGGDAPLGLIGAGGAVRPVEGLHVVDASVLPRLPTANPQLPVMAVAERLSSELCR